MQQKGWPAHNSAAASNAAATVEAMKMEIPVGAERVGVIGAVLVVEGAPVNEDDGLATLA